MEFSDFLKLYRKEHNLTQKEMAKIVKLTPMYYGRFENDQLIPTKTNLSRFSKYLSIPMNELEQFL